MPTDNLPLQVKHFLLRACPTAALAADDIVAQAVLRDARDEDVISMLASEYNCDRHGWPKGPLPPIRPVARLDNFSAPFGLRGDRTSYSDVERFESLRLAGVSGGAENPRRPFVAPQDPTAARRRRLLINYYTVNQLSVELNRIEHVIAGAAQDSTVTDLTLIDGLKAKYHISELGEPTRDAGVVGSVSGEEGMGEDVAMLRYRATTLFKASAPERLAEVEGIIDSFRALRGAVSVEATLQSVRRSLGGCSSDGWPLDPAKRRLARLHRFFLSNDPAKLVGERDQQDAPPSWALPGMEGPFGDPKRRVTESLNALVNSDESDQALFMRLYYVYGRDEFGQIPPLVDGHLKQKVTAFLSHAAPLVATEPFVFHYLAVAHRHGLCDEAAIFERRLNGPVDTVVEYLQGQFAADDDGWPLLYEHRVRNRVVRYLMRCQPQDLDNVDTIVEECITSAAHQANAPGRNPHESLIVNYLHEKYGRKEDGSIVLNTPAMRNWVIEFLEQYVPEDRVDGLASKALEQRLHPDALKVQLQTEYASFTPFPYKLRGLLNYIYARAAPAKRYQIDQILRVKRAEGISDRIIVRTVCEKLGVGPDGWPTDPVVRLKTRLQAFFEKNDPPRLIQLEMLLHHDERTEEEMFEDLYRQYGKDELGNTIDVTAPNTSNYVQVHASSPSVMSSSPGEYSRRPPAIGPSDFGSPAAAGPRQQQPLTTSPPQGGADVKGGGTRALFRDNLAGYSWMHESTSSVRM